MSKEPIRYSEDRDTGMYPHHCGEWVRYDDHAARITSLESQLSAMTARAERAEKELRSAQADAKSSLKCVTFDGETVFGTFYTDEDGW